jgi:CBS domain-containing protein
MGPPYPTSVSLNTRLDEVIDEFANNRGSSIIVVDDKNKPVGRILADDLVDALAPSSDTQGFAQGSGAL